MENENQPEKESSLSLASRLFRVEREYHFAMYEEAKLLGKQEEAEKASDNLYDCCYRQTQFYDEAAKICDDIAKNRCDEKETEILKELADNLRETRSELAGILNKFALKMALARD